MSKKHITFKVWIEIERLNEKTGIGQTLDAPGSSLATFKTYREAWDYAEYVTRFADHSVILDPASSETEA